MGTSTENVVDVETYSLDTTNWADGGHKITQLTIDFFNAFAGPFIINTAITIQFSGARPDQIIESAVFDNEFSNKRSRHIFSSAIEILDSTSIVFIVEFTASRPTFRVSASEKYFKAETQCCELGESSFAVGINEVECVPGEFKNVLCTLAGSVSFAGAPCSTSRATGQWEMQRANYSC